MEQTMLGIM